MTTDATPVALDSNDEPEQRCRSTTGDVMLCTNAACGWTGRCVYAPSTAEIEAAARADSVERKDALLLAARCVQGIEAPGTWDEDDKRWRVCTHSGTFYGDTLDDALAEFWRSALQARDDDGEPTEPDPFKDA